MSSSLDELAEHGTLWATCDRCGELRPVDEVEARGGVGLVCYGCDPGAVEVAFGETMAARGAGSWIEWEPGHDTCAECDRDLPLVRQLADEQQAEGELIWLGYCGRCFLIRSVIPWLAARAPKVFRDWTPG